MDPLVGVVVGGGLALLGQLSTETFRTRREKKAEERAEQRAKQLSVRLVMEELAEAQSLIFDAAESGFYWVAPRVLPTNTWNDYRTDIATVLDAPLSWRMVTAAYDSINNLNWIVGHRRATTQDSEAGVRGVRLEAEDETRAAWRSIRLAIETLEGTLHVSGPASRVMREREDVEREYWPHGDGDDFDLEAAVLADQERQIERLEAERRGY